MNERPILSRISQSVVIAGKCALVFAPALFVFLFATILMVRGDGTAPAVTHVSAGLIDFTAGLLGVSSERSVLTAVMFWSLAVFAVVFVGSLLFSSDASADRAVGPWPLGIAVVVLGAVTFLIRAHEPQVEPVDERALAVEFVRSNAEVMQAVGGSGEADLLGYSQGENEPATYEIAVYGAKTLYAFVEVLQSTPVPRFKLVCTTPLGYSQRDPAKPPCER